jgi:hypothetical protein
MRISSFPFRKESKETLATLEHLVPLDQPGHLDSKDPSGVKGESDLPGQ